MRDLPKPSRWTERNRAFLESRASPLEFYLHRSQYMRLLLATHPPDVQTALAYAKAKFPPFYHQHSIEVNRLMNCVLYLPIARLQSSPYPDLASPALHLDLEPLFAKEYCASLGMSRQVPLRVVGDIGGGGALARIEKGRKVMRERKSEWSQSDELPVRHSIRPNVALFRSTDFFPSRSKLLFRQRIDITPCSHVPSRRNSPPSRTHQ